MAVLEPYALDWLLVPIGQRYDVLVTHGVYDEAQVTAHLPALDENNEVVQVPVPLYRVGIDRDLESVANRVVWPEVDLSEFSERAITSRWRSRSLVMRPILGSHGR